MKSISEVKNAVNGNSPAQPAIPAKFLIFQEVKWPTTGGVDMDALPTQPTSVPVSRIRELRPAKTWKTWDNTVEVWLGNTRIAVRGTLTEIVAKLNTPRLDKKPRKPFEPFALTPREARIQGMREDGFSRNQIALAFNTGALRIAKEETVIDRKLEAAAASHSAGRIWAGRETMAMMRDPDIHPDATI